MYCINKTYFFTHIPQPIHRISEINAILSVGLTSMHNFPGTFSTYLKNFSFTFLHSWAHLFGLHRLASTIAIRVILSDIVGRARYR
ncbi:MAG: hypothetical protein NXY57DRAFT_894300 [Lentinula lateritia]|nr:MAG: hypothetical protein NXY57DRAFT_894300 [Lentinula lateritia]